MIPSFLLSSSDEAVSDEEAEEAERQALLQKKKKEHEAIMKRRRDAREQFEEGRFAKVERIENDTFAEVLQKKSFLLSEKDKSRFRMFIPRVVEHFDRQGMDFRESMAEISHGSLLINMIKKCHKTLVDHPDKPENIEMHNFLVEFHEQVFSSLRQMTNIPDEDVLATATHGNVFAEARLKVMREEVVRHDLLDGFEEKARKAREEKEKTEHAVTDELADLMRDISLVPNLDGDLLKMLASCSLDEIGNTCRDTSPPRQPLPSAVRKLADQSVAHLMVDSETRTGERVTAAANEAAVSDDEDVTFSDFLKLRLVAPLKEAVDIPSTSETVPSDEANVNIKEEDDEDTISSDDSDVEQHDSGPIDNWKNILHLMNANRQPTLFGIQPSNKNIEDWRQKRFEDRHRKKKLVKLREKKGIRIAPFKSPLNKMRIFVKPLDHFFTDGDDGPRTDHVDLSLDEGWKAIIRKNDEPPLVFKTPAIVPLQLEIKDQAQRLTESTFYEYLIGYHGNLLGRFWFLRDPEIDKLLLDEPMSEEDLTYAEYSIDDAYKSKRNLGFLRQYTQRELEQLYSEGLSDIHRRMKRGFHRTMSKNKSEERLDEDWGEVASVLILTDWRLAHLNKSALTNAYFKYMPTNLGAAFFDSMTEYIYELLMSPNIEIDTIIFAFGGSPRFKKENFLAFFKKLIMQTLKRVDVLWTAQDWWDGLPSTEAQRKELDEFNSYVKRTFAVMKSTGHRNYKWIDVREEKAKTGHPIPPVDPKTPLEIIRLEPLYCAYVDLFVKEGNCCGSSGFWMPRNRRYDRHPENNAHFNCIGTEAFLPYKS